MTYGSVRDLVSLAVYGRDFQDIDALNELYEEHDYAYVAIFPATKRLYEYYLSDPRNIPSYKIVNCCADIDCELSAADRRSVLVNFLRSLRLDKRNNLFIN